MKVAILYEQSNGVKDTLFHSLNSMFEKINVDVIGIDYAYSLMNFPVVFSYQNQLKHKIKLLFQGKRYQIKTFNTLYREVKKCDFVIVITVVPEAFLPKTFDLLGELRRRLSIPILSYSNYFFGNRSMWPIWIINNYPESLGYDTYDYYLCSSVQSCYNLPALGNPFIKIGFSLQNTSLTYTKKNNRIIALIDFPRSGYEELRALQLKVLHKLNIETIELTKKMSREELYNIYDKCSFLFLSFPESFGVPILEFQAAGGLVFIPNRDYVMSHWLNNNADLGSNFILYEENERNLEEILTEQQIKFNAKSNFDCFVREYPDFFHGNLSNLKKVVEMIHLKKIQSESHKQYGNLKEVYRANLVNYINNQKPEWQNLVTVDNQAIETGKKLN